MDLVQTINARVGQPRANAGAWKHGSYSNGAKAFRHKFVALMHQARKLLPMP
jgi:hypothetical protein